MSLRQMRRSYGMNNSVGHWHTAYSAILLVDLGRGRGWSINPARQAIKGEGYDALLSLLKTTGLLLAEFPTRRAALDAIESALQGSPPKVTEYLEECRAWEKKIQKRRKSFKH
jgi:hypothetical protein